MNEHISPDTHSATCASERAKDRRIRVERLTEEIRWFIRCLFDESDNIGLRWCSRVFHAGKQAERKYHRMDVTYSDLQDHWARWAAMRQMHDMYGQLTYVDVRGFEVARRPRKWAEVAEGDGDDNDPPRCAQLLIAPRFVGGHLREPLYADLQKKMEKAGIPAPTTVVCDKWFDESPGPREPTWGVYWRLQGEYSLQVMTRLDVLVGTRLGWWDEPIGDWVPLPSREHAEYVFKNPGPLTFGVVNCVPEVRRYSMREFGVGPIDTFLAASRERIRPPSDEDTAFWETR